MRPFFGKWGLFDNSNFINVRNTAYLGFPKKTIKWLTVQIISLSFLKIRWAKCPFHFCKHD